MVRGAFASFGRLVVPHASKKQLRAMREERVFRACREHAEWIIAELAHSYGDHGEDVEVLLGLIETWGHLEHIAAEELDTAGEGE